MWVLTDTEETAENTRTEDVLASSAVEGSTFLLCLLSFALATGSLAVLLRRVTLGTEESQGTSDCGSNCASVTAEMGLRVEGVCGARDEANVDWKQSVLGDGHTT